jgi:hypothetical protein
MGFLNFFPKEPPALVRLPSGSFTVDRSGTVLTTTVSSSFSQELVREIAEHVLSAFREAHEAQLPLSQLILDYPSLKISASELRGGAMVFLLPKTPFLSSLS